MTTLTKDALYVGTDRTRRAFVLGVQFGPMLLACCCDLSEAIDEWDERYGRRVDPADSDLLDYNGATTEERIESAMSAGDLRINDGGTMVWVDPYEWMREFPTVRDAGAFYRA